MADNLTDKEARLCETIRMQFQREGVFDEIKCQLQSRLVEMMRGGEDGTLKPKNVKKDSRTQLLNHLIMEYFHWYEYNYSAEMFAMETGAANESPNRALIEAALGEFKTKEIPILLEVVLDLWQRKQGADDEGK